MIRFHEANFMDHLDSEHSNLQISLWNSGDSKRKEVVEKLDYMVSALLEARKLDQKGDIEISEKEKIFFQLYMIFKRFLFSTISAFFRGYYDISLSNARIAFEASMYVYIFYYDKELEEEYKQKKLLRKLDKKFSKKVEEKKNLGEISSFLTIYSRSSERGAHCDYHLIEETTVGGGDNFLLPLNDLLDERSGEFNQKLFEIFEGFLMSLKIFNLVINSDNKVFSHNIASLASTMKS